MSDLATLNEDHTLRLPVEVAKHFKASDRFLVWREGETLVLKRISASPLKAVEQGPSGEPLSLVEINDIVHEVRRKRHHKKGK